MTAKVNMRYRELLSLPPLMPSKLLGAISIVACASFESWPLTPKVPCTFWREGQTFVKHNEILYRLNPSSKFILSIVLIGVKGHEGRLCQ